MTISNLLKMADSSPTWKKTPWVKEKLLVSSNFYFSHSVFKRLVPQTHKNKGLLGKGLILSTIVFNLDQSKILSSFKGLRYVSSEQVMYLFNPVLDHKILASSKLKAFADNKLTLSQTKNFRHFQTERVCNFKLDENGRTIFRWVENTVGKGEIARYEQFLLFSQSF